MRPEHVIKRPLILTEKGNRLREAENQYMFEVATEANKAQIRTAVEKLWNVSVEKVHTLNVRGRVRRMGRGHAKTLNWKKAIVTLKSDDKIDFFEGV